MTKTADILLTRMQAQFLLKHEKRAPADIVKSLGGIQGQDYGGGQWSIGLRLPGSTLTDIERAISRKEIVRTWAMRGTLRFLAASDIRWMLDLLAPQIIGGLSRRYKELGLDHAIFRKAGSLLARSLKGGNELTREELVTVLEKDGICCEGQRATFILPRQELFFGKRTWVVHGVLWTLFHVFWKWNLIILLPICLSLSYVVYKRKNTWIGIINHMAFNSVPLVGLVIGIIG